MKAKGVILEYHLNNGVVKLQLMSDYRREFSNHWVKHKTAVHEFEFNKWYKRKSTGQESQNNHAWGHSRQIAQEIGDDPREVLREACLRTADYPVKDPEFDHGAKLWNGHPKPWGGANSKEAAAVIETLHRIAAFLDIKLIENWGEK